MAKSSTNLAGYLTEKQIKRLRKQGWEVNISFNCIFDETLKYVEIPLENISIEEALLKFQPNVKEKDHG